MKLIKKLLLFLSGNLLRSNLSKIIFYHDVFDNIRNTDMGTPLEKFKEHLEAIRKNGFEIVTRIGKPEKQVQICFDDGFRGVWECRDFFYAQSWRPTIFIAVDLIGKAGYLAATEIIELQQHGFIFQSHAWSHEVLTDFHGEALVHEIADSKKYLSDLLGREVDELCFPVGYFSDEVLNCCFKSGYKKLYSSIPGNYNTPVFPNVVRRNLVQFSSALEVRWILKGALIPFAGRYYRMHYHS